MQNNNFFWKEKTLTEFTEEEWELICDGCGCCCLHKLQDEDTGDLYYTHVACKLLDISTCQCIQYSERFQIVPGCLKVTAYDEEVFSYLPNTCSYKLLHDGYDLPAWHHLVSGSRKSIHEEGISVQEKVLSENNIDMDDLEEYVMD